MSDRVYIIIIVGSVIYTLLRIIKKELDINRRKGKEIVKLNKHMNRFLLSLFWLVLFFIWSIQLIHSFHSINEGYIFYQANFLFICTWTIIAFCNTIINFHLGWHNDAIYQDGISINGKVLNWSKISDYNWSNKYKKKLITKGEFYDLTLILSKYTLLKLNREANLTVNEKDWELIDGILKDYRNKRLSPPV
ncbi:hypothetical protein GC105_13930 [Alkalibaculum sp. M08DMB]|uniref:DUF5673 domain-containing protein n=1 Tax=Alkalibaculum sporogenes TaxID=2655001 RepID=A0A6A7KC56_9FIRM|nr:hypothetical protein [Alkalibaculum sporogenes]MPW26881.1 hypothetical protein [Alkalibaculum sporogenes]